MKCKAWQLYKITIEQISIDEKIKRSGIDEKDWSQEDKFSEYICKNISYTPARVQLEIFEKFNIR
jgi:hypothetical protein